MARYEIHETLINKLEAKLTTIRNKCAKYGCEFLYSRVGEIFKEVEDKNGRKYMSKYIVVETEGKAIVNGWRFIATVDHIEAGNVIRQFDTSVEIPVKYRSTDPICEHCNTKRNRSKTCIIYNESTQEFRQVGATCLNDFTGGLSAEHAAWLISWFEELEKLDKAAGKWDKSSYRYYDVETQLLYAYECITHFGFVKASDPVDPTFARAHDFYEFIEEGRRFPDAQEQMMNDQIRQFGFKAKTEANKQAVDAMIAWILSQDTTSDLFLSNLQVIVKSRYVKYSELRFLASLVPTYRRYLERKAAEELRAEQHQAEVASSNWVGNIKDKVVVDVASHELVTSWTNQFGWSGVYKFVDAEGNIFKWITSVFLEPNTRIVKLSGTVKEHSEYNEVKETVLTRCKVEYKQEA